MTDQLRFQRGERMNVDLLAMALRMLDTVHNLEAKAKYSDRAGFTQRMERIGELRGEVRRLADQAHAS